VIKTENDGLLESILNPFLFLNPLMTQEAGIKLFQAFPTIIFFSAFGAFLIHEFV
jgi:hypothetical protein